ncbi:NAD(+) diphosphatase [Nocardiopsis ansamitocini]|uniref:NAD(+) diphosphatase n=1 Tax=Nocardiopsis ansamitocini TaxID=1670832 RepID=A0A9W6UI75_9ACTN|nr:NAD(+) diphosphatase [Nocardiopsis ansamitocini]GLU46760.1 NTP pyrophosphohydrolase [Nocardiopsis ansamitocini]
MTSTSPLAPALSRGVLDLIGHRRTDSDWLGHAWADPRTRVLVLEGGDAKEHGWPALMAKQSQALVTTDDDQVRLVLRSPGDAPDGERYLLGQDAEDRVYFAVRAEPGALSDAEPGTELSSLRTIGALLDPRDSGMLTHAVALANWHAANAFCPRCGSTTRIGAGGHTRICETEGTEQFPRMDPAVIMLVHRVVDGVEQCLLAHNPVWPDRRYSVLAGFVEPGESLEHAVVREVAEEVGVVVDEPVYLGSQPWPFPRSLMFGYFARATGSTPRTDQDEIADVRWFTRGQLLAAVQSQEILLPSQVSIARQLIESWYGGTLPGSW